jgi:hypothetical protein
MSQLLEIRQQLQGTSGIISQLETALSVNPESLALQLNLSSVLKRFGKLEEEFSIAAARDSLDICTYKLFASAEDKDKLSLRGISGALHDFQIAFSSLFDALKNGRRMRSRITPDIIEATSFDLGYAYAGSLGVVLTMPRERLLLGSDMLDDTVTTFFNLAHAPSPEDIRAIGVRLGPAPLRAIYRWAQAHVGDGLGAEISWRHGEEISATLFIQHQELERLSAAIAATSEETRNEVNATGRQAVDNW